MKSALVSCYKGQLTNLHEAWQGNTDSSPGEAGVRGSLSSCYSDIGIPINFQLESIISTFRSIELRVRLEVSRYLKRAVQMRQGPRTVSRVFTGDSDIPSSCEMKDEPALKPLQ